MVTIYGYVSLHLRMIWKACEAIPQKIIVDWNWCLWCIIVLCTHLLILTKVHKWNELNTQKKSFPVVLFEKFTAGWFGTCMYGMCVSVCACDNMRVSNISIDKMKITRHHEMPTKQNKKSPSLNTKTFRFFKSYLLLIALSFLMCVNRMRNHDSRVKAQSLCGCLSCHANSMPNRTHPIYFIRIRLMFESIYIANVFSLYRSLSLSLPVWVSVALPSSHHHLHHFAWKSFPFPSHYFYFCSSFT